MLLCEQYTFALVLQTLQRNFLQVSGTIDAWFRQTMVQKVALMFLRTFHFY